MTEQEKAQAQEKELSKMDYFLQAYKEDDVSKYTPSIVSDKKKYFDNIVAAVKRDTDLLKYLNTREDVIKLISQLEKLARVGLTIGGIKPQAYIIGFNTKNGLSLATIPTADGYKFIASTGKNAIFKNITLHEIHQNDKEMHLDEGNGIYENPQTILSLSQRGDIIGYVFDGMKQDGFRVLKFISIEVIDEHKKFSKQDHFWKTHYKRMCEKTAIKYVLRDFIYVCEGLANMEELEDYGDSQNMTHQEKADAIDADSFIDTPPIEKKSDFKKEAAETKKDVGDII